MRGRWRAEMRHMGHASRKMEVAGYVSARDSEVRMIQQMPNIRVHSGDKIIENQHVPALRDQTVTKMRPEKSRSAGDHCAHPSSSLNSNRQCNWSAGD